ncbi:MmgE/PrpD family protein [Methylobacterium sp. J-026]|uniref:MmgE/PrpD family protein n=1 Tax=Methylobacterium sp. J-026 TaxID=2836624 RepID=UPI001FBBE660|nr:MmgE/PrpD family protein [Methylobacterium sp. J-026]MCJ2133282.1 MmgE/PrpD family protein [Methylobacterium sp. J-026]
MAHPGTVIEVLAAYAASERAHPLPETVLHHAKRALIDWFAALLPGARLPPATLLAAALADEFGGAAGGGRAVVYGTGLRAPLRTAALINATASHIVEFDDIFRDAIYHPGCPVIGAALAAAQTLGADGAALLRAIVVGYEVSTRIGVAVQPSHYRYWHTTGTIGTFGAAAATASLLGLDAGRTAHALATAATMAAGLQQAFRSDAMSKPLHAGHAAEAGALAALAAGRGVTGALDVLEGEAGFGAAMSRGAAWDHAVDELGRRYNICAMTFKNHGCCGHAFAAIDAALVLRPDLDLDAIADITVGTYRTALDVTDRRAVATPFEGRFSTPFTVASALVHGSVRLDAFSPERLADPRVQALMRRVEMVVDPESEGAFPARRSAVVTVALTDGRRLTQRQPTRKGDPDAPLTDDELADKFRELAAPAVGAAAAADLLASLRTLDTASAEAVARLGVGPPVPD